MKENQKKSFRSSAALDMPKQSEAVELKKEELRAKIQAIKNKNLERERNIRKLKQEQHILRQACIRNEEQLVRTNRRVTEIRSLLQNPQYFDQLRDHFRRLRVELGMDFMFVQEDDVDPDNMTYEQLLELGERIGKVSKGLSETVIKGLPRMPFSQTLEEKQCAVCCDEFNEGDGLIQLKCTHYFHDECISSWLKNQKICPLCKKEAV